jgi:hypothetical protein
LGWWPLEHVNVTWEHCSHLLPNYINFECCTHAN